MWRNWPKMPPLAQVVSSDLLIGWSLLVFAVFLYASGKLFEIIAFELGAIIPFLMALLTINFGLKSLKVQWFPLFFMVFMIPLPNALVDFVTIPMKIFVSFSVEHILYFFDYPIARSGVILQLGQYKLLVANACAGLHTLLTLEAMGLLYLNLVQRDSLVRNVTLAILIIPISLTANVIRVLVLCLVTYYLGDEMGQSYLHDLAGFVLFISALILIVSFDSLIQKIEKRKEA